MRFSISNIRFHVRKYPKNPTDLRMEKSASGKTTIIK